MGPGPRCRCSRAWAGRSPSKRTSSRSSRTGASSVTAATTPRASSCSLRRRVRRAARARPWSMTRRDSSPWHRHGSGSIRRRPRCGATWVSPRCWSNRPRPAAAMPRATRLSSRTRRFSCECSPWATRTPSRRPSASPQTSASTSTASSRAPRRESSTVTRVSIRRAACPTAWHRSRTTSCACSHPG